MKAQEINAVFQGKDICFRIQRKPARLYERFNLLPALLQIYFVVMDQKEVVHIAPVIFDTQLFLYEVIQPVKVEKGEKL